MKGTQGVKEYLLKYRSRFLLTGLLVFLLHGAKLNSGIIGIDTEDLIRLQDDFYGGWLHTGRQGLVFLKYLLGNVQFNPYFAGIMTLLLFSVSVGAFFLLWDRVLRRGGRERQPWAGSTAWFLGGLLWISHPVLAEQFYFSLQSMEISMAMLLIVLSLYLSYRWADRRHPVFAVAGVCSLILAFSVYQTFVVMYIFGAVSLLLLQALEEISGKAGPTVSALFRRIFSYFAVFITAFILNTLITRLFFGSSDYLHNQIYWGAASWKDCIHAIGGHVIKAFTGYHSVFYNAGFGALALFDLILLGIFFREKDGRKEREKRERGVKTVVLLLYLALLATPFLMTLVLGGAPAARSQLVLPAAGAFLGYLASVLIGLQEHRLSVPGRKPYRSGVLLGCGAVLCLVCGTEQAKVTESLYYTDSCRYQQDTALGRELIRRIEEAGGKEGNLPVIVIGGREFSGNNSCVTGEVIGRSFFHYDIEVEPKYFWSTRRILGFLHTLGADYPQASEKMLQEALEYSANMPEWPGEESVQEWNGMIVVKLSDTEENPIIP